MTFLEFTEGPLWYIAATVFCIGATWRVIGILRIGRKPDLSTPRASAGAGAIKSQFIHFVPRGSFYKTTYFHILAGYLFHLGLFAAVLFAAPHIVFIEERIIGFGWPALPRWGFIIAAEAAFAGLILLWFRRITDPVVRLISDRGDHISSWLTFLVMLTGCLALGESSDGLRALHMLMVDIWLIYFPFSRLMHAVTFMFSRGYTGAIFGRRGITP
jgi:nitrate reductase gamma subunit